MCLPLSGSPYCACSHLANNHKSRLKKPDYEALRPILGCAPIGTIKSRVSGANVGRRSEPAAMYTYFTDTPAIDGAVKMAQRKNYQSKPHHQHQNYADNRVGTLKDAIDGVMGRSGAPANLWLFTLIFLCILLSHMPNDSLGDRSPLNALL